MKKKTHTHTFYLENIYFIEWGHFVSISQVNLTKKKIVKTNENNCSFLPLP